VLPRSGQVFIRRPIWLPFTTQSCAARFYERSRVEAEGFEKTSQKAHRSWLVKFNGDHINNNTACENSHRPLNLYCRLLLLIILPNRGKFGEINKIYLTISIEISRYLLLYISTEIVFGKKFQVNGIYPATFIKIAPLTPFRIGTIFHPLISKNRKVNKIDYFIHSFKGIGYRLSGRSPFISLCCIRHLQIL